MALHADMMRRTHTGKGACTPVQQYHGVEKIAVQVGEGWDCWGKVLDPSLPRLWPVCDPIVTAPLESQKNGGKFQLCGICIRACEYRIREGKGVFVVSVTLPRVDLTMTTRKLRVTSRGVCAWKTTQCPILGEKVAIPCLWPP
jgi:hypothetical protein